MIDFSPLNKGTVRSDRMSRAVGDTNLSLREKRKDAEIAALKLKLEAEKAAQRVKDARIKELQAKLKQNGR